MSINDIKIVDSGIGITLPTRKFRVDAGAVSSLDPGEPVKVNGNYVALLATGDPEVGTDRMVGVVAKDSTETATVDGTVDVYMIVPNITLMRCDATTPANIDTDAKLLALLNDSVTFTLTSTTFTVNEDEGDDPDVHGLIIIDGDINEGTLDFVLKEGASIGGLV